MAIVNTDFIPRKFRAKINEFGLDDYPDFSGTFKVQSLKKDKVYEEQNPAYLDKHPVGVVVDDNGCWWHYGTSGFNERFEEIKDDVKPFIHKFDDMEIGISRTDGIWEAKVISGNSGVGLMTGGKYETTQEYIANVEREHRYSKKFFSKSK